MKFSAGSPGTISLQLTFAFFSQFAFLLSATLSIFFLCRSWSASSASSLGQGVTSIVTNIVTIKVTVAAITKAKVRYGNTHT